jgi:oxygen-independent coproporphyrinogen-3 oxidase
MKKAIERGSVGLYVHVPYCASLCGYCDFCRTQSDGGVPEGFEDLVLAEARLYQTEPRASVDTVYFGGGTPSLLEPARLGHLLRGLQEVFNVDADSEVTLEANPETVTFENLSGWLGAGVGRLSVGVQSTDPTVLRLLERAAGPEQSLQAVEMALAKGFKRVSADLMTGVPGQSLPSLMADVALLAFLPVDHLSI